MIPSTRVHALALVMGVACAAEHAVAQSAADGASCPITEANGRTAPGRSGGGNHGNDALVTALWPFGTVKFAPGGSGFVLPDGALAMKFPWWRLRDGALSIEGRRLDGEAAPLRAHIPCCYSEGFQATSLIFPTPGCWEVTGRVAGESLTFVTQVIKIGAGPVGNGFPPFVTRTPMR